MAEKEYIEHEAAKKVLADDYAYNAAKLLDEVPKANVQDVVRCSNCIHIWLHSSGYYHCSVTRKEYKGYELGYHFCSYGKKV